MKMTKLALKLFATDIKLSVRAFRDDAVKSSEDSTRYYERGFRAGVLDLVDNLVSTFDGFSDNFDESEFLKLCGLERGLDGSIQTQTEQPK